MAQIITHLSVLTLDVNVLNSLIKPHHVPNWIKKEDLTICCLQKPILLTETNTVLGWKGGIRFAKLMSHENRQE
jgi:hypothetical protein